jgi:hypothetical protein
MKMKGDDHLIRTSVFFHLQDGIEGNHFEQFLLMKMKGDDHLIHLLDRSTE